MKTTRRPSAPKAAHLPVHGIKETGDESAARWYAAAGGEKLGHGSGPGCGGGLGRGRGVLALCGVGVRWPLRHQADRRDLAARQSLNLNAVGCLASPLSARHSSAALPLADGRVRQPKALGQLAQADQRHGLF